MGNKHLFLKVMTILVVTSGFSSPAGASLGWSDSSTFAVNLLSSLSATLAWDDSTGFGVDLRRIDRGWGNSPEFALSGGGSSQPGVLEGTVYNKNTGQPVAAAEITVAGTYATQSNDQGYFSFSGLPTGSTSIVAAKSGYYVLTQTVIIHSSSSATVNLVLTPQTSSTLPAVVEVKGKYSGAAKHAYYLHGVPLNETFAATIDWKGYTPYQVKWITPSGTITDTISGTTIFRTFAMGHDFGAGGKLRVQAMGQDGAVESALYTVNFDVIPMPPIVNLIPGVFYEAVPTGEGFEYRIMGLLTGVNIDLAKWEASQVEGSFPIFGGQEMKIGLQLVNNPSPWEGSLSGKVTSDGTAEIFTVGWSDEYKKTIRKGVRCRKGIKLPFIEAAPEATLTFKFNWSKSLKDWAPGGELELGCDFKYSSPQIPVGVLVIVPIYVRAEVDLDLALTLGVDDWTTEGPQWYGQFDFEPLAKGILGAGVAHVACVEGYLGGGFHATVALLPALEWQGAYIILVGGVQATFGPLTFGPAELRYEWPEQESQGMMTATVSMNTLLRHPEWCLLSRDYLKYRVPESLQLRPLGAALEGQGQTVEQPIETAVFPYSVPNITRSGPAILAVWIADDTGRSLINRTELSFARYDANSWSASVAVADDGTADLNPQLIALPDGDAACIWQDANGVLNDANDVETFTSHLELAVSTYDHVTATWSTAQRLTDNAILDRSPKLAATATDDMIAVWISNGANDLWGSYPNAPNSIMWSAYDGSAWTESNAISAGWGTILDTALAYNGAAAALVFCVDADDNLDTPEDQDLWMITYTGGAWSAPIQLTTDPNTDAAPRLAYDSSGTLHLAWLRGHDICVATGTDVAHAQVVAAPQESLQSKDFDLVMGGNGQIALVWNDVSETYNDIWVSYCHPVLQSWSKPRQLTQDDAAERFISGAFDADGNLFCVYDKNHTEYEDREEVVNGQTVVVQDVPKAGRSDLTYLRYELTADLQVTPANVQITPSNPAPGSSATISATVNNLGESAVSNVAVAFYDGDPQAGGVRIGQVQTIAGPIAGGDANSASVSWVVPQGTSPHRVFVVVDPNMTQDDRDWGNNAADIPALAANLTVSEITSQKAGQTHILTVRVSNVGVVPADNVTVVLKQNDPNGPTLASGQVATVAAGAYHDISFTLSNLPYGQPVVCAVLDGGNQIDELSEDDNTASLRVLNFAPGDFDANGYVDVVDLAVLAEEWLLTGDGLQADISPVGGDDVVNLADFAELAAHWPIGSEP